MTDRDLCKSVKVIPPGARVRKWTLNDRIGQHNGKIYVTESPLYLNFSWLDSERNQVHPVGIFRLDLEGLIQGNFARWDPKDSSGPGMRLRIDRAMDGEFYIQINQDGPRLLLS